MKIKKKSFPFISPILIAGILLILLPIFTVITVDRLERQKEFSTQRLLEKGVSLIRTFEAGTRTGMFTMRWGAQRIQAMLLETSLQPEVIYIMITSKKGRILAHSDESMVGRMFDAMPEIEKITKDSGSVLHRVRQPEGKEELFEVIKRFVPVRPKSMRRHLQKHGSKSHLFESPPEQEDAQIKNRDWSSSYLQDQDEKMPGMPEHYIFAGLSMEREKLARKRVLRGTVWRGVFFLLLGCAGMVALFAFQAYRSARASLTRVTAFSDNMIQNMPSGMVTMNLDYEITFMNRAAKDIFKSDLTTPFPQLIELIHELKTSKGSVTREINLSMEFDRRVWVEITASPIKDSDNRIMEFLFLFRDLTQVRELKKQVETNERLAAIGKLAAGVAHEIRNPLSSIKGFATYFGKRYEKNATDKETALIMVKEVERINRSITQLLEFAKPMSVEKKKVDIKEVITHSLKLVHHDLVQKNIQTKVAIDTKNTVIQTDGDRMNQVLLNLYINAIAALEDGGMLEIRVQDAGQEGRVEIRVMDNGKGISEASLDQIFDPYFTTRSSGTGLGLSIVHRIIENLNGHIHVESTEGHGTCFIINLPVL